MKTKIMAFFCALLALAAMAVSAEDMTIRATIEFPFMVQNQTLPAGMVEFMRVEDGMAFRVKVQGQEAVVAMVVTRLSGDTRLGDKSSYVVFDKYEDHYHLSEIWFPGEDGYLITATKGEHKHETVKMK